MTSVETLHVLRYARYPCSRLDSCYTAAAPQNSSAAQLALPTSEPGSSPGLTIRIVLVSQAFVSFLAVGSATAFETLRCPGSDTPAAGRSGAAFTLVKDHDPEPDLGFPSETLDVTQVSTLPLLSLGPLSSSLSETRTAR